MDQHKPHKTKILILIVLLIAVSLVLFYTINNHQSGSIVEIHGNVDIREVDLGFRVSGKLEKMSFEEGDSVKTGDLMASLDKIPYENILDDEQAQLKKAAANLLKFKTGSRPQEIEEAVALVQEKQVAYDNAVKTANRQAELLKKNYASKQRHDDAMAEADEAKAQLKTANESLKLAEEGFRREDIMSAIAEHQAAEAQFEIAQTNLADTDLYAPNNGIILTRIEEPGSILNVGDPVYTLSLIDPIWVRAYISEINLGRIKPGMKVLVYTDTDPENPFEGQIGFISPKAEFTPKNVETKSIRTDLVYRLRITVEDKDGRLRQGMPVTVTIDTKQP